jgi:hypothetical protein
MVRFDKAASGLAPGLACLRAGAGSISDLGCTRDDGCGCPVGG